MSEPQYVYFLEARGISWLIGEAPGRARSTTAFTTKAGAERRIEQFRQLCIDQKKLSPDFPINVTVEPLEIIPD